jgi:hypothetical protein
VTAELERRWEAALRELKDAEENCRRAQQQAPATESLSPEDRDAFLRAGQKVPELWRQDLLAPQQQKAFLRCLVDKVIVHRAAPDLLRVRIIWRGGATTTAALPVTVGSLARLSRAPEMQKKILELAKAGQTDEEIAALLTREGHRSPHHPTVLPSTVRLLRLRHRLLRERRQSHPRRIPGHLTVPQVARAAEITPHWIYDRIHNGTIRVTRDRKTRLYLFPDGPKTITLFKQLQAGTLQKLRF